MDADDKIIKDTLKLLCDQRIAEGLAEDYRRAGLIVWTVLAVMLLIGIFVTASVVHAEDIKDKDAIMSIIGEAEGEPEQGRLAIACAIRNRGTLDGVYGRKAPRVVKHLYNDKSLKSATENWQKSANPTVCQEIIAGADHWGSTKVDSAWIKKMQKSGYKHTATIGNHAFYKKP